MYICRAILRDLVRIPIVTAFNTIPAVYTLIYLLLHSSTSFRVLLRVARAVERYVKPCVSGGGGGVVSSAGDFTRELNT